MAPTKLLPVGTGPTIPTFSRQRAPVATITGPRDSRDLKWLEDRVVDLETGFEAVLEIARNWTDGRNVARFYPGQSAADYLTSRVGAVGKAVVPLLLVESNWSNPQIAAVAGVGKDTVRRARALTEDDKPRTLGADGKLRPARVVRPAVAEVLEPLDDSLDAGDPESVAFGSVGSAKAPLELVVTVSAPDGLPVDDPAAEPSAPGPDDESADDLLPGPVAPHNQPDLIAVRGQRAHAAKLRRADVSLVLDAVGRLDPVMTAEAYPAARRADLAPMIRRAMAVLAELADLLEGNGAAPMVH